MTALVVTWGALESDSTGGDRGASKVTALVETGGPSKVTALVVTGGPSKATALPVTGGPMNFDRKSQ